MGLYLTIFEGEEELDGVEVGSYHDYDFFIKNVTEMVESGSKGLICPTLVLHHDSDGEWTSKDALCLRDELIRVKKDFIDSPSVVHESEWVHDVLLEIELTPCNAYESFVDVDGENLVDRLIALVELSINRGLPILFQ